MNVSRLPIFMFILIGSVYALPIYSGTPSTPNADANSDSSTSNMATGGVLAGAGVALTAGGLYANHRNSKDAALADQQISSGRMGTAPPDFAPERPGGSAQQYYDNHPLAGASSGTSNKDTSNAPGGDDARTTAFSGDGSSARTQDAPLRGQQYTPDPEMNRYNQYTSSSHGTGSGVYSLDMPEAKGYVPYSGSADPPRYSAPPSYSGGLTPDALTMPDPLKHGAGTLPYPDMRTPGSVNMPSVQNTEVVQPKPQRPWQMNTAQSFENAAQDNSAQRVASVAPQLPEVRASTPLSMNMAAGASDDLMSRASSALASGTKGAVNAVSR